MPDAPATLAVKPTIAITLGDPAGIGPEIVARVCHDPEVLAACRPLVVGQERLLAAGAAACGLALPAVELVETGPVLPVHWGQPGAPSGDLAAAFIHQALELCTSGRAAAMATAPISKEALAAGGHPDTGHTTMLGRLLGVPQPVMMFAGSRVKVALCTIHVAYRDVPDLLTPERICHTGLVAAQDLKHYFALRRVRLGLAGLNPHAGEGGMFGDEELLKLIPAMEALNAAGIETVGPIPPDTIFWRAVEHQEFDCVIAMYHDQGLIPFKLLHFHDGVNVTLGLPIIRTSCDHGTAFELAGRGVANPASLKAAVIMAAEMAANAARAEAA